MCSMLEMADKVIRLLWDVKGLKRKRFTDYVSPHASVENINIIFHRIWYQTWKSSSYTLLSYYTLFDTIAKLCHLGLHGRNASRREHSPTTWANTKLQILTFASQAPDIITQTLLNKQRQRAHVELPEPIASHLNPSCTRRAFRRVKYMRKKPPK